MTIFATGGGANVSAFRAGPLSSALAPGAKGGLLVLPTLQVVGFPGVYAVGDVAHLASGPNSAFSAYIAANEHVPVVAHNLGVLGRAHSEGRDAKGIAASAFRVMVPTPEIDPFVLSLGRRDGLTVCCRGSCICGATLSTLIKGDALIKKYNALLSYAQPGVYPDAATLERSAVAPASANSGGAFI